MPDPAVPYRQPFPRPKPPPPWAGTLDQRKRLFRFLVKLQDQGVEAGISRRLAAAKFGVGLAVVRAIEREAELAGWPLPPVRPRVVRE